MTDPFQASRVKVKRAEKHIAEFEAAWAEHLERHPVQVGEVTPERPFGQSISGTGISGDIASPIMGDTIHNLRAALDLMAVALVDARKENTNKVYFPFCEVPEDLDKIIKQKNFHRAGAEAVELLKKFAPYAGGNSALRGLHDLDIQDKHHTLIPIVTTVRTPPVRVDIDANGKVALVPVPFDIKDLLGCLFPDDSAFAGQQIIPTLKELVQLVHGILEAFAALIPKGEA